MYRGGVRQNKRRQTSQQSRRFPGDPLYTPLPPLPRPHCPLSLSPAPSAPLPPLPFLSLLPQWNATHVENFCMPFPRVVTRQNIFNSIPNSDQSKWREGRGRGGGRHPALLLVIRFCVIWTCSRFTAESERRVRVKCCKLFLFFSFFSLFLWAELAYFRQRFVVVWVTHFRLLLFSIKHTRCTLIHTQRGREGAHTVHWVTETRLPHDEMPQTKGGNTSRVQLTCLLYSTHTQFRRVHSPLRPSPFPRANNASVPPPLWTGIGPTYSTSANLTLICFYFRVIAAHNHFTVAEKSILLLEKDLQVELFNRA